jgi:hypothetical protein
MRYKKATKTKKAYPGPMLDGEKGTMAHYSGSREATGDRGTRAKVMVVVVVVVVVVGVSQQSPGRFLLRFSGPPKSQLAPGRSFHTAGGFHRAFRQGRHSSAGWTLSASAQSRHSCGPTSSSAPPP